VEALEERCLLAAITEFGSGITPGSNPSGITRGSDGNLWFTELANNALGRITPAGTITQFSLAGLQANSVPLSITSGPNGLLYFTENGADRVGRINPRAGTDTAIRASLTQSAIVPSGNGTGTAGLDGITTGSDGNLWFTEAGASNLGSVTPNLAVIHELPTSTPGAGPAGITAGPDGALWFAESAASRVGRVVPPGTITTVAGNGTVSFGGDNGPATAAELNLAAAATVDATGDLFIADFSNNRVCEVTPSGIITTVAGNGTRGFSGDDGPATAAELSLPEGVAVDAAGDLFIADTFNHRVRKVSPSGIITTVAGSTGGFSGDGGPATAAQLFGPSGVAVDAAGDLYIADTNNGRVREVSPSGIITTVAGNGTGGFSGDGGPATAAELNGSFGLGLALDAAGDLFIADSGNNRVREVTPSGVITTVAGNGTGGFSGDGGPATAAGLDLPAGVAVDAAGDLFIADFHNQRAREVSPSGVITTVAGNGSRGFSGDGGPATAAELNDLEGVAVDAAGDLFIADTFNSRVREVSPSGIITTVAGGTGDGGSATRAALAFPSNVAVDAAGDLFIADPVNERVREVTPAGVITTVAGGGNSVRDGGPATAAQLFSLAGLAVDAAGDLYIADASDERVREVLPSGIITTAAGSGTEGFGGDGGPATAAELFKPAALAVDAAGDLFIADTANNRVRKVSPSGIITTVAGNGTSGFGGDGGPATAAQLSLVGGLAVDAAGDLYIADTDNSRVREVSAADGTIATVAGAGTTGFGGDGGPATAAPLNLPQGLAVDAAGDLYIADSSNNRVREVSPSGVITTVAGNTIGFGGDGSPATTAELDGPQGLALDAAGDLFIADSSNNRVREITSASGAGVTEFALTGAGPKGITAGPDGNLWFTESGSNQVGKITPAGAVAQFKLPTAGSGPQGITAGPDGNLWFTETAGNRVGSITSAGVLQPEASLGITAGSQPLGIVTGPDGNLWFTEAAGNQVAQLVPPLVADQPLTATGTSVSAAATVAFSGPVATFSDADTSALPADYAVAINWGDSTPPDTTSGTVAAVSGQLGHFIVNGSHTYAHAGSDTATVTITDINITTSVGGSTATATDSVTVTGIATTTKLTSTANPVVFSDPFAYMATVSANAAGSGTPTGSVDFVDTTTGTDLGTAPLNNGTATLIAGPDAGAHHVTATYGGDLNFAVSGGALDQTVNPEGTTTKLTSSLNPSTFGDAVTFTATVTGLSPGSATPSGTVTFMDTTTGTDLGTGTLEPGTLFAVSTADVNVPALSPGQHTVVASYSSNPDFAASSDTLIQTVHGQPPNFTSSGSTTFTVGTTGSFMVVAGGAPAPSLTETGALPGGVAFQDNSNGTATLSGTPAAGTAGTYSLTLTAHNGAGSDATQSFSLTVNPGPQPPAIISPSTGTFVVGAAGVFTVVASGTPAPTLSESPGDTRPAGVTFNPATGVLSGTPATGSGGSYTLHFTAHNGAGPDAAQTFTLAVDEAPSFSSSAGDTFTAGTTGSFRVTAVGFPVPTLSESPTDALPTGLTFNPAVGGVGGAAVGLLSGTPAATSGGSYTLHFAATNGVGVGTVQTFTLTVDQAPAFASPTGAAFTAGAGGAFRVSVLGFPAPTVSESGALPAGVTFDPASGLLGGTPAPGTAGTYAVSLSAGNGVGSTATQTFTLTVTAPAPPVPPPVTGPLNLAGLVGVSMGPLTPVGKRRKTGGTFQQTLTVTNNGTSAIQGPIVLVLDSLTPRKKVRKKFVPQVTVAGAGGTTQAVSPGNPFVAGPALLPVGGTITFRLTFQRKGSGTITFNPILLAGYTQP
jgi:streptogramin lyase